MKEDPQASVYADTSKFQWSSADACHLSRPELRLWAVVQVHARTACCSLVPLPQLHYCCEPMQILRAARAKGIVGAEVYHRGAMDAASMASVATALPSVLPWAPSTDISAMLWEAPGHTPQWPTTRIKLAESVLLTPHELAQVCLPAAR